MAKSQAAAVVGSGRGRAPVVNVSASTSPSLLAVRAASAGSVTAQPSSSLLAGLSKAGVGVGVGAGAASPSTITVTKPPVVTVTKQGLTPGARPGSAAQVLRPTAAELAAGSGSSAGARQSPVIVAQDPSSRSSTPTAVTVATPPPSGKLVTTGAVSGGVVVAGQAAPPAGKLVTLAQPAGSVSGGVMVTGAGDGAMITRLVQQVAGNQQVVSVSNLPGRGLTQAAGQQRGTTLKIQGGWWCFGWCVCVCWSHAGRWTAAGNHTQDTRWVVVFWMVCMCVLASRRPLDSSGEPHSRYKVGGGGGVLDGVCVCVGLTQAVGQQWGTTLKIQGGWWWWCFGWCVCVCAGTCVCMRWVWQLAGCYVTPAEAV